MITSTSNSCGMLVKIFHSGLEGCGFKSGRRKAQKLRSGMIYGLPKNPGSTEISVGQPSISGSPKISVGQPRISGSPKISVGQQNILGRAEFFWHNSFHFCNVASV